MFIGTHSGGRIYMDDIAGGDYRLEDIACGLSKVCRFSGQISTFYPVAVHAISVAKKAYSVTQDPKFALYALHHDDTEAYMGDVPSPVKAMCPSYKVVEAEMEAAIFKTFGFSKDYIAAHHEQLKVIDSRMCITEAIALLPNVDVRDDWGIDMEPYDNINVLEEAELARFSDALFVDHHKMWAKKAGDAFRNGT